MSATAFKSRLGPAFRRTEERRQEVRVGFDAGLLDRFDRHVEGTGKSRSETLNEIVRAHLNKMGKAGPK
jgi:metal-responsive CopG/Arc/MetJ family transcriptional regulator